MGKSDKDIYMIQAISELKEANKTIADNLVGIKENLKTLNDNNILHTQAECTNHNIVIERLDKYWWLIIALFIIILIIMGYKEAVMFIIK